MIVAVAVAVVAVAVCNTLFVIRITQKVRDVYVNFRLVPFSSGEGLDNKILLHLG